MKLLRKPHRPYVSQPTTTSFRQRRACSGTARTPRSGNSREFPKGHIPYWTIRLHCACCQSTRCLRYSELSRFYESTTHHPPPATKFQGIILGLCNNRRIVSQHHRQEERSHEPLLPTCQSGPSSSALLVTTTAVRQLKQIDASSEPIATKT